MAIEARQRLQLPAGTVRRALEEFWLHVNFPCNLACTHCLFSCNPRYTGIPNLTLVQAQDYAREAMRLGIRRLFITGGEPLMWQPLRKFLSWLYGLDSEIPTLTLFTNGTIIGEQWAERFARYVPRGLELRVSLECYSEEINDRYRGKGSHALAMRGIRHLNARGIKPTINWVNKSGGTPGDEEAAELERDFQVYLRANHGAEIERLHIIGAYDKGAFQGCVHPEEGPHSMPESWDKVMCSFGLAASGLGLVPCPILTDVREAVLTGTIADQIGAAVEFKFRYCEGCFLSGST